MVGWLVVSGAIGGVVMVFVILDAGDHSKMLQAMYSMSSGASAGIVGCPGGRRTNPIKLNRRIRMSRWEGESEWSSVVT